MRVIPFLAPLLLLIAACHDSDTSPADDDVPPDAGAFCTPPDVRASRTAAVSGQVIDFVTLDSVSDALVSFTTAWDTDTIAPADECDVIDAFRTGDDGRFGPATLEVGSQLTPPIALYQITEAERAPTASDQTMTCQDETECLSPDHLIRAVSAELGDAWRAELTARDVGYADTRGLVLFEFREQDGTPAAGVTPILNQADDEPLTPGVEVHYLTADRSALAPAETTATTASGVALLAVPAPYNAVAIGGRRGSEAWDDVGVLVMQGWFFLEDQRRATP